MRQFWIYLSQCIFPDVRFFAMCIFNGIENTILSINITCDLSHLRLFCHITSITSITSIRVLTH